MAASVAVKTRNIRGVRRSVTVDVTGDNSYATGGYALTAAQLATITGGEVSAFSQFTGFECEETTGFKRAVIDRTNSKILFAAGAAEAANASDQSAVTIRCRFEWGSALGT